MESKFKYLPSFLAHKKSNVQIFSYKLMIIPLLIVISILSAVYLLSDILYPFIFAFIIAYLLEPIVVKVSKILKIKRVFAVAIIFLIIFILFFLFMFVISPMVYSQISHFIKDIPAYKEYIQNKLLPLLISKAEIMGSNFASTLEEQLHSFTNQIFSLIFNIFTNFWSGAIATINILILFVVVPVISFLFSKDWPLITSNIIKLIPLKYKHKFSEIAHKTDTLLSAYVRGQLNICFILTMYYSIGLSIIGLDFSLLIGILSGFAVIVPVIGITSSFVLSILIAYLEFSSKTELLYIFGLYIAGYLLEASFLTPTIIGNKIGLHPIWIIFSLFMGAKLFGATGVLLAIPVAGIIKIIILSLKTSNLNP